MGLGFRASEFARSLVSRHCGSCTSKFRAFQGTRRGFSAKGSKPGYKDKKAALKVRMTSTKRMLGPRTVCATCHPCCLKVSFFVDANIGALII